TGVRLALLGRADPAADAELAANLGRFGAELGQRFCYLRADVTDREAVLGAVREAEKALGTVTAILHGAGHNAPRLVSGLDEAALLSTLRPKLGGAQNLSDALTGRRLRLLVTFGSVIARTGMPGEAHYALANEWLTQWTERFQAENPDCRCLAVEWSVWSGVGMGERLGRGEALGRQGVTPLSPRRGGRAPRAAPPPHPPPTPPVGARRLRRPPAQ